MAATNGYERLVRAAASLTGTEIFADDEPADAAADAYLAANAEALASARQALAGPCRVPLRYVADFLEKHCGDVPLLANLGRSFALELGVAARRGQVERAVQIGLDLFELGDAARRGGLMIDLLAGNAILGLGVARLHRLRGALDFDQCRALAREIIRIDARRESFAAVQERDDEWERRFPPGEFPTFDDMFDDIDSPDELDEEEELEHFIYDAVQEMAEKPLDEQRHIEWQLDATDHALVRLLAVELALTAYRRALGGYPDALDELVPGFLPEVPLDPCMCDPYADSTAGPLRYRRQGDDYVLYSVGPSGEDSGGRCGSWWDVRWGGADLCSGVHDYPSICPAARSTL